MNVSVYCFLNCARLKVTKIWHVLCAAARAAAGGGVLHARHCAVMVCPSKQLQVLCLHLVRRAAIAGESYPLTCQALFALEDHMSWAHFYELHALG